MVKDTYAKLKDRLIVMMKAKYPYTYIVSEEEDRVLSYLASVCSTRQTGCYVFDAYLGWRGINDWLVSSEEEEGEEIPNILSGSSLIDAFNNILDFEEDNGGVFVIPDFHQYLQLNDPSPLIIFRKLKWLEPRLRTNNKMVVMISTNSDIPHEISNIIHVEDVDSPSLLEICEDLEETLKINDVKNIPNSVKDKVARAALGLNLAQANRLFYEAIVTNLRDPQKWVNTVVTGKKGIIASSGSLEFFSPDECPKDLAGVEALKNWLSVRRSAFTKEAEEYNLPQPKGVGLIGIPGTGKSLTAKFIAGEWGLPLIRFDIGAVFGSLVGQSEENMRKALKLAESIAPCILWIDEIEKAFPKDSMGGDAGTSTRVLANFLTWLQEHKDPVFVVATANDVQKLPPELLRKGRFDEIFFLDLPSEIERKEIFSVHLKRVKRDPSKYNLDKFVATSKDFVGAEIEQAVKEALYKAFSSEPSREPTDEDVIEALNEIVPLSETRKADIDNLRGLVERKEVRNASKISDEKRKSKTVTRPKAETS
ncbi:MAG: AAA family ATPase [Candidatus Heimdallarchaeota archaeon]|nr:AAA family ATPase [Candidatus Heimdallarchaeota archaeon]